MKLSTKNRILQTLAICGSCISFYIGAGFASMQEIVQYEVSYGSNFTIVILLAALIYLYTNISFATNANRLHLVRGGEIYGVYFSLFGKRYSKYVATFFDYFSALFCYMSFVVMCGGFGATLEQQWGISTWIGAFALSLLVVVTTVFGLKGILNILSLIGPIIIAVILLVSVISAISGFEDLPRHMQEIDSGVYAGKMQQVGAGNPVYSAVSYGGFVVLWFAAFLAEIGSNNERKCVNLGMILSSIFIFGTATMCCIALIGHVELIVGADIPSLLLAKRISPVLAKIFAIVICLGIYTSATPLLWTAVRKMANENTKKYISLVVAAGFCGSIIASAVPYQGLINVLYGLNGYLGIILVIFMIIYDVVTQMSAKTKVNNK